MFKIKSSQPAIKEYTEEVEKVFKKIGFNIDSEKTYYFNHNGKCFVTAIIMTDFKLMETRVYWHKPREPGIGAFGGPLYNQEISFERALEMFSQEHQITLLFNLDLF